jgi:hypothetical protein
MQKDKSIKELLNDLELSEEAEVVEEGKKKTVAEVEHEDEEEGVDEGEHEDGEDEEEMEESKKSVKEMDDEDEDEEKEINAAHCEDAHEDEEEEQEEDAHEDEKEDDKEIKASYKEEIDLLVNSTEGLTEDFKDKAAIIFEAAFTSKVRETTEKLEEKYQVQLVEETDAIRADLVEKVDSYLDYVVNEWVEDNEVAIDSGLRTEITEDFMGALKTLFTEHYIEVPESKVDLFDTLEKESSELNNELQESKSEIETLKEEIESLNREKVLAEASEDLTTTQAVKLASLVEGVEFVDVDTFARKVETIKDSIFSGKQIEEQNEKSEEGIIESTEIVEEGNDIKSELSPTMQKYSDALSRLIKSN